MSEQNNLLDDQDVVSFQSNYLGLDLTMKVQDIKKRISNWIMNHSSGPHKTYNSNLFLDIGSECEVLQQNGKGWNKGKLRFRIEFIPDEPDLVEETDQSNLKSLDDFRR